ncbi:Hypothetical Protein FCC1311_065392 [Hondaea fermentalgiana]|uniref:Uncharacterized protein n=1 Tax=Hondaea fermentalgiana TaxID=2315210 RepID=A0A2R5GHG1_9STRA|nr:Hypothetical Protein FCC1311_065392 [Hondaea fermentalgiana]|eukprot:GBG30320.1 Hypothetical Protein FCC1311_065392 [Hondaea fermentalgiana]
MAATSDSGKALLRKAYDDQGYAPGWGGANRSAEVIATATAYDASAPVATAANPWGDVVVAEVSPDAPSSGYSAPPPAYEAPPPAYEAPPPAYGAPVSQGYASSSETYGYNANGSGSVGPQTIARYNEVTDQAQALSFVEGEIRATSAAISKNTESLDKLNRKLHKARKDLPKAEARLNRNANPHFFHYMQINRSDKVQRLEKLVNDIKSSEEQWVGEKHSTEQSLAAAQKELKRLRQLEGQRTQLLAERTQIYDQVVASVPPTLRLRQIETNITAQKSNLAEEQSLLSQVNEVLAIVQQAQRLYGQSMEMLDQAQRMNNTAQFSNLLGAGRGGGGLEFYETANQFQRDRLINDSQRPAEQAYQLISRAWQMFPQEVRRRYPAMSAQIGQVPLPRLRSAHFGNTLAAGMVFGDIGDAINNGMATGKIRENLGIVQRCVQIVDQQLALVVALRNTIQTDVDKMTSNMNTLSSQRAAERDDIFQTTCAQITSGASGGYNGYNNYM